MEVPATQQETTEETPTRAQRRRARKVTEILATTAEVLAERGYHDTSLDEIAERLDVAKASLYHYFPSKEALVSACIDLQSTEVNRQLREVADATAGPARERLAALIERQLNVSLKEAPHLATLYRQPLDWPPSYQGRIKELRREHYEIFHSVVRDGISAGEFAISDVDVAMHNFFGALNYVPVWCHPRTKKDFREATQTIIESLLRLFSAG